MEAVDKVIMGEKLDRTDREELWRVAVRKPAMPWSVKSLTPVQSPR